jgi:UDP-glucose 4-epimerase
MRILVTGGTGFLGGKLLPMLAAHEVFALTRRSRAASGEHVSWIEADLGRELDTAKLPEKMDAVIHLAQSEAYKSFPEGAADMFSVNVAAPSRLLQWACGAGVSRVVLASTGSVYEPYASRMDEEAPLRPAGYYPASKIAMEMLSSAYASRFAVSNLRVFFLYGPGESPMMIARMIDSVQTGSEITLPADGEGLVFNPTYVDDCAGVFARACEEGWHGVWNVACPQAVSLGALVRAIGKRVGREPNIRMVAGATASRIVPDLTKLGGKVDLGAFLDVDAGLAKTIARP